MPTNYAVFIRTPRRVGTAIMGNGPDARCKADAVNLLLTIFLQPASGTGKYLPEIQGQTPMGMNWTHSDKAGNGFTSTSNLAEVFGQDRTGEDVLVATCLMAAAQGDISAYFDLGVAYSTGSHGVDCDLIEAHKWFNLAAVSGHEEAPHCRADISEEMTAREIAEAQRRAREWISATSRKVA